MPKPLYSVVRRPVSNPGTRFDVHAQGQGLITIALSRKCVLAFIIGLNVYSTKTHDDKLFYNVYIEASGEEWSSFVNVTKFIWMHALRGTL